jgi:hypothetical protein
MKRTLYDWSPSWQERAAVEDIWGVLDEALADTAQSEAEAQARDDWTWAADTALAWAAVEYPELAVAVDAMAARGQYTAQDRAVMREWDAKVASYRELLLDGRNGHE